MSLVCNVYAKSVGSTSLWQIFGGNFDGVFCYPADVVCIRVCCLRQRTPSWSTSNTTFSRSSSNSPRNHQKCEYFRENQKYFEIISPLAPLDAVLCTKKWLLWVPFMFSNHRVPNARRSGHVRACCRAFPGFPARRISRCRSNTFTFRRPKSSPYVC